MTDPKKSLFSDVPEFAKETPQSSPGLLTRQQVLDNQRLEPLPRELIEKFNQWIQANSYLGQCSIPIFDLRQALGCFHNQFLALLVHLSDKGWQITNNNGILEFR